MGHIPTRIQRDSELHLPSFHGALAAGFRLDVKHAATLHNRSNFHLGRPTRLKNRDHSQFVGFRHGLPAIHDSVHLSCLHFELQGVSIWLPEDKVCENESGSLDRLGKV